MPSLTRVGDSLRPVIAGWENYPAGLEGRVKVSRDLFPSEHLTTLLTNVPRDQSRWRFFARTSRADQAHRVADHDPAIVRRAGDDRAGGYGRCGGRRMDPGGASSSTARTIRPRSAAGQGRLPQRRASEMLGFFIDGEVQSPRSVRQRYDPGP
jgi:hypothetical protein